MPTSTLGCEHLTAPAVQPGQGTRGTTAGIAKGSATAARVHVFLKGPFRAPELTRHAAGPAHHLGLPEALAISASQAMPMPHPRKLASSGGDRLGTAWSPSAA